MARFYGSVQGSAASEATRQGTPSSGISGHIRGWSLGVQVDMYVDQDDEDVVRVYLTRGSGGGGGGHLMFVARMIDGIPVIAQIGDRLWEELSDDEV